MSRYQTSTKTRQALIDAAGELAVEKGLSAISTRAIAQLAGENIGSIHYHFGSKENLFEAMIRSVAQCWINNPLGKILNSCDLTDPAGQATAIRLVIIREAALLFDPETPSWHSRVIFQVLQYPNSLQNLFRSLVLDPESELLVNLMKSIDPNMNNEIAYLHYLAMLTPMIFHVNHQDLILAKLGKSEYSHHYLQHLIDICITQTLLLFNLPTIKDEIKDETNDVSK